jgi:endonuclease/exonuclease/phosphatase (EEP) superfamily protein YafD
MSKLLRVIVVAGLVASALLTAAGLLAYWRPALDIVNNGLPFLAVGCLALLGLALAARNRMLIVAAAILLVLNAALFLTSLPGFAPDAPEGSTRFLRVATFNLWGGNEHTDSIVAFLDKIDADAVVLEEVRTHHKDLLARLDKLYPHRAGDYGLVILSKYPILTDGRIDRASQPPWISLIIHWVRLDVNGTQFDLVGVHLARPFYPELQQADIIRLTKFVQSRSGPLILAGDCNMAPWTVKLKTFTQATGLRRYNTFRPTWPMRWRDIRLLPLVPIDNVFASGHFTSLGTTTGPYLGSDHRPVIADIARSE